MPSELIRTQRLLLQPMRAEDSERLFPMFNDESVWWYDPDSRHLNPSSTEVYASRAESRWKQDGLSYWVAVLAESPDIVVGSGGAQRHRSGVWNLNYRIVPDRQRQGFGVELARAGIDAANAADPDIAVVAWIDSINVQSQATARAAGLHFVGEGIDSSDGATRFAFVDRKWSPARSPAQ